MKGHSYPTAPVATSDLPPVYLLGSPWCVLLLRALYLPYPPSIKPIGFNKFDKLRRPILGNMDISIATRWPKLRSRLVWFPFWPTAVSFALSAWSKFARDLLLQRKNLTFQPIWSETSSKYAYLLGGSGKLMNSLAEYWVKSNQVVQFFALCSTCVLKPMK